MGDVVNLNQYRKQRERSSRETRAAENRVRHGKSKADRMMHERERARLDQDLQGKQLLDNTEPDEPSTPA